MADNPESYIQRYLTERLGRIIVLQNQNISNATENNAVRAGGNVSRGGDTVGRSGQQNRRPNPNIGRAEIAGQSNSQQHDGNANRKRLQIWQANTNRRAETARQLDGGQQHGGARRKRGNAQDGPQGSRSQSYHRPAKHRETSKRNTPASGRSSPTGTPNQMDWYNIGPEHAISVDGSLHPNIAPLRDKNYGGRYNRNSADTDSNKPRDRNPRRPDRSYMGFQRLENFSNMEPEQLVLILMNEETGLDKMLKTDLSPDYIVLLLKIINRLCESAFNENKGRLLIKFCQKEFIDKLMLYINNILHQDEADKKRNKYFWGQPNQFWDNLLMFYEGVITLIPNTAVEYFPKLIKATCLVAINMGNYQKMPVQEHVKEKLQVLQQKIILCQEERTQREKVVARSVEDEQEPPDNFREISLYPLVSEVTTDQYGFVRRNIIEGGYRSVDHYLDVQFRLLREDFVAPLRFGICAYMKQLREKERKRLYNVRLYPKVYFLRKDHIQDKVAVVVQFHPDPKTMRIKFENSRRFMYGSLVCFTNNGFNSIIFGTIVNRNLDLLKQGLIAVEILENVAFNEEYVMVESTVYFEPYYFVLRALQLLDEEKFPMKQYIVDVQPEVHPPSYLSYTSKYSYMGFKFYPLDICYWPSAKALELDQSQYKAFQAAITREFCVIQGPPGTGKTYIGLKVAEILLKNLSVWRKTVTDILTEEVTYAGGPILVICFTNHALDQFLEGILKYTDKLIRVGGQSKNEALNKHNIKNVRFRAERLRVADSLLRKKRDEISECMTEITGIQKVLNEIAKKEAVLDFQNFLLIDQRLTSSWFMKATRNQRLEWLMGGRSAKELAGERRKIAVAEAQARLRKETEYLDINSDFDEYNDADDQSREREVDDTDFFFSLSDNGCRILTSLTEYNDQLIKLTKSLAALENNEDNTYSLYDEKFNLELAVGRITNDVNYLQMRLNQYTLKRQPVPPGLNYDHPELLRPNERWGLYFYWLDMLQPTLFRKLAQVEDRYRVLYRQFEEVKKIEDIQIMKDMYVLGMTTSGAARYQSTLQALKCPIVIVEEAAEVLESHIVVSLTKDCKHLILIGDHQQLRPTTSEYRLAKHYYLEISLFERMVRNGIHCEQLEVQHRMRPEIVRLIVPAIYQKLENHISVESYPPVMGVDKNVFFITHTEPEEEVSDSGSKRNIHEATFLIRLARHFILQGYEASDITILATYSGQMFCLWQERKKFPHLEKVRVTAVDNYQGEENKIILLSLVRSNNSDAIGFLKIDNRVCVALSRAKEGLFIIGNMDILQKSHNVWPNVKAVLEEQGAIGSKLLLRCQVHATQVTYVAKADDFQTVSEGGCTQMCGKQLVCGHICGSLCHITDRAHEKYKCKNICNRSLCDLEHLCPEYCFEECKPCGVLLQITLRCNHIHMLACNLRDKLDKCLCPTKVPIDLECGHKANKPCYKDIKDFPCPHPCDIRLDCGHACTRKCHIYNDPDHIETKCYKQCTKLRTGCTMKHACPLTCHEECPPCDYLVKKKRSTCGHVLEVRCPEDPNEVKCTKKCNKKMDCGHICRNLCKDPCTNCPEKVKKTLIECGHTIEAKCCEKADRKKCRGKCPLELPCGHKCIKRCFEPCTVKCVVLVNSRINAGCGHVFQIPCHQKDLDVDPMSYKLLRHCKVPCNTILKCGHKCSGTCGECMQGRMHKTCQEKCGNVLICGHACEVPCRQACEPCSKICTFRCAHSKCGKKCGVPCKQCMEPCLRRCPHVQCDSTCGDICDCDPCEEPCPKLLKCGHPCLGFCDDICPPLCRVCDPENDAFEIFLGSEGDDDARFIYLEECRHIIEASGMDMWLMQDNGGEINNKTCPKCKTPITKNQRYSDYVKRAHEDVIEIKSKYYGNFKQNEATRHALIKKLAELKTNSRYIHEDSKSLSYLLSTLNLSLMPNIKGKKNSVNKVFLSNSEAQIELIELMVQIHGKLEKHDKHNSKCLRQLDFLLDILSKQNNRITEQEIADMQFEINRFEKLVKLTIIEKNKQFVPASTNITVQRLYNYIDTKLQSVDKFTDEINLEVNGYIQDLCKAVDASLKLTDEERKMIVSAVGLARGHWYKCPNGHYYCIGECGGAMQVSRCNECGAQIGGQSHSLLSTNRHAGEMDGSTNAAWSDAANLDMRNFIFDN